MSFKSKGTMNAWSFGSFVRQRWASSAHSHQLLSHPLHGPSSIEAHCKLLITSNWNVFIRPILISTKETMKEWRTSQGKGNLGMKMDTL